MIRNLLGLFGRFTLMLASAAFLTAVGLLVLGSWLVTFPIMRLSPRERRIRATVDLAAATVATLGAFADKPSRQLDGE